MVKRAEEATVDSFFVGILSGIAVTVLARLGVGAYRLYQTWQAFRPFKKIWSPFAKGPSCIVLSGKQQGHTLKVSANERDAAGLIKKLLPTSKEIRILIANGDTVNLQGLNIIAFGSERDNEVTRALLSSISAFLNYEYTADNDLIINGELFRSEYKDNVLVRDYALVCKAANPYSPNKKCLVFSGNHGIGTQGAVVAVTSQDPGQKLLGQVRGNDFYAVIETRIDKRFGTEPTGLKVVRCGLIGDSNDIKTTTKQASREEKLEEFLRQLGADDDYLMHVRPRTRFAVAIARSIEVRGIELDTDAVYFGTMLHDIGRTVSQAIDHGLKGAEIVLKHKVRLHNDFAIMPDTLAKIIDSIECHVVGGLRREWIELKGLELPLKDYLPKSLEAQIVTFADQIFHAWDAQEVVLREAPALDEQVYRQFYMLTKAIVAAAFGQAIDSTKDSKHAATGKHKGT